MQKDTDNSYTFRLKHTKAKAVTTSLSLFTGTMSDFLMLYNQKQTFTVANMSWLHREQVELCVDILERILMALSPVHLAQNYRAELHGGLTHPQDTVKILALTQVSNSHFICPSSQERPKKTSTI